MWRNLCPNHASGGNRFLRLVVGMLACIFVFPSVKEYKTDYRRSTNANEMRVGISPRCGTSAYSRDDYLTMCWPCDRQHTEECNSTWWQADRLVSPTRHLSTACIWMCTGSGTWLFSSTEISRYASDLYLHTRICLRAKAITHNVQPWDKPADCVFKWSNRGRKWLHYWPIFFVSWFAAFWRWMHYFLAWSVGIFVWTASSQLDRFDH